MNNNLSPDEQYQVKKLITTREYNNNIAWLLVDYLNQNSRLISRDLMLSIETENVLQEEIVYCSFLSTFCGLDIENNVLHKQIERDYFERSVKKLNIENYTSNPYLKNIHIPEGKILKNWKLEFEKYTPYESFIYRDIILDPDFKEIPQIGFFNKTFKFPAVKQNNREWMAIKPNEIETMKHPLEIVRGNIVTFGLGLGYFAYMASIKKEVEKVTIVESDPNVIYLFKQFILPQFRYKDKIEIVLSDAFNFEQKEMPKRSFNYAFVDLWHDISDGLNLYLKMKKLEYLNSETHFLYWIENSLLSAYRWQIFDTIIENAQSYDEICFKLSNSYLSKMAAMP